MEFMLLFFGSMLALFKLKLMIMMMRILDMTKKTRRKESHYDIMLGLCFIYLFVLCPVQCFVGLYISKKVHTGKKGEPFSLYLHGRARNNECKF